MLASDEKAFRLLALIAARARYQADGYNPEALAVGEALIGDHRSASLTRAEYRSALARLERSGFIATRTTNKGTVATLVNRDIFDPLPDQATTGTTNAQPPGDHQTTIEPPSNDHRATTNKKGNKGKKGNNGEGKEPLMAKTGSADFDRFWSTYPKKVGKRAAEKAFLRALADTDADSIIEAVEISKRSRDWIKDGGQFVPHPTTWLNQGRYLDTVEAEKQESELVF